MINKDNITVENLDVTKHSEFKNHEKVFRVSAPEYNFVAFVGVHSTVLGAAEGGIRYKPYDSEDDAITDVLRLSEGMTLKNAGAGLSAGGGKTVVMALDGEPKPSELVLQVLAEGLNRVNEKGVIYFGAQDMNISEENLNYMGAYTRYIKGASSDDPQIVGGTPSPLTAIGVFEAMKQAVAEVYGAGRGFDGLRVSLQGIGSVGGALARLLDREGAVLTGCDIDDEAFAVLRAEGVIVRQVDLDEIYDQPADIFAPNAIGGTISDETAQRLANAGVLIVCGAANNQQKEQVGHKQSKKLQQLGILYCPDFIVNAGGIIWVNQVGMNAEAVRERIRTHMPQSLKKIIQLHQKTGEDMGQAAENYSLSVVREAAEKAA